MIKKYIFLVPIIIIIIIKIPHLAIPYFWDEAWSYYTAVYRMYETGPGILPGALPLEIAKGHPLFFYFIHSLWMRIFGTSVTTTHILSLLVSVSTLLATYFFVKKHVNRNAALMSISFLSVQSLFLGQATMVLPEMLIALLLVLSTDFYLRGNYKVFALFASLMVMTKETAIIYIFGFMLFHFLQFLRTRRDWKKFLLESLILFVPAVLYAIFLFLHKLKFGTFLNETHLSYIQLTTYDILKKLRISSEMIFELYGRYAILYSSILAIIIVLVKNKKIKHIKLLFLLFLQSILFLGFSILNFFTYRYLLGLMAFFIIFSGIIIQQASFKNKIINYLIFVIIIAFPIYYSFTVKTNSARDLGYVETVKVHQEMVKYCEEQNWQDKEISASFNMIYYLRDPSLGYITGNKGFTNVSDLRIFRDSEIFLIECTNHGKELQIDTIKIENCLAKEFQIDHAWGEIYTNLKVK